MSDSLYLRYQEILSKLPPSGKFMPYDWVKLPNPLDGTWMPYSFMIDEFSREIANSLNAFTNNVNKIHAWSLIVDDLEEKDKISVTHEFIDVLATNLVNTPYVIRSRFIFAASHLCHQANRLIQPEWKDDFPLDSKVHMNTYDQYSGAWKNSNALKIKLEKISGNDYKESTYNFRNTYNHRFSPRFVLGLTGLVTRSIDRETQKASYGFGETPPLNLRVVTDLLIKERDNKYEAFDAFQALVREHVAAINLSTI